MLVVLDERAPEWPSLRMYEPSSHGPLSEVLQARCSDMIVSDWWKDTDPGGLKEGVRCEDLQALTFRDATFDVVITQDVLEHVPDPALAFAEIARVLRPGGLHIFTVPDVPSRPTRRRARSVDGTIVHELPPEYHSDPIDEIGTLVFTDFGWDVPMLADASGLTATEGVKVIDRLLGLDDEHLTIWVSRRIEN